MLVATATMHVHLPWSTCSTYDAPMHSMHNAAIDTTASACYLHLLVMLSFDQHVALNGLR